jgi:hypothetical protein
MGKLPFPLVDTAPAPVRAPVPRGDFGRESLGVSWHRACCAPAIYTFIIILGRNGNKKK